MYARHTVVAGRRGNRNRFQEFDLWSHFGFVSARCDIGTIIPANRPSKSHNRRGFRVKLSSISYGVSLSLVTVVMGFLTACETPSQPVAERLDPNTATTLAVVNQPVELINEGAHGTTGNPFAFIAPFQTDRSGKRVSYLWVSAPSIEGAQLTPKLVCEERVLPLSAVNDDLALIGLSSAPYTAPIPWNAQWYFQLPDDQLDCLAGARFIALETYGENGVPRRFSARAKDLGPFRDFKDH
jgi:hypothetical protein